MTLIATVSVTFIPATLSRTPHLPHFLTTDNVERNTRSWVTNLIQIIDSVRSEIVSCNKFLSVLKKCLYISTVKTLSRVRLVPSGFLKHKDSWFSSVFWATYYFFFFFAQLSGIATRFSLPEWKAISWASFLSDNNPIFTACLEILEQLNFLCDTENFVNIRSGWVLKISRNFLFFNPYQMMA